MEPPCEGPLRLELQHVRWQIPDQISPWPKRPKAAGSLRYRRDSGCEAVWTEPLWAEDDLTLVAHFETRALREASVEKGRLAVSLQAQPGGWARLTYTIDPVSLVLESALLDDADDGALLAWTIVDRLRAVTEGGVEATVELRVSLTPDAINDALLAALERKKTAPWSEPAALAPGEAVPLLIVHVPGKGLPLRTFSPLSSTLHAPVRALPPAELLGGRPVKDARLIAVVEHTASPVPGPCGRREAQGPVSAEPAVYTSARARVTDARSGKLVSSRRFRGTAPRCDGNDTHWIDFEKIRSYLREVVASERAGVTAR